MANTLDNSVHQRSLKDFLTLYNTITEYCFNKCISNFNERYTSGNETECIETCTNNYVQYNQRFMFNFVDHQERRKREQEAAAVEAAAQASATGETNPAMEQLSPEQLEQVQKTSQLLENLSSSNSSSPESNVNSAVIGNVVTSESGTQITSSVDQIQNSYIAATTTWSNDQSNPSLPSQSQSNVTSAKS